jgi:hypothetical protein
VALWRIDDLDACRGVGGPQPTMDAIGAESPVAHYATLSKRCAIGASVLGSLFGAVLVTSSVDSARPYRTEGVPPERGGKT